MKKAELSGSDEHIAKALSSLAMAELRTGNFKPAINKLEQKRKIDLKRNQFMEMINTSNNLAIGYARTNRKSEALKMFKICLERSRKFGLKAVEVAASQNVANVYFDLEEYDKAEKLLKKKIMISKEIKYNRGILLALKSLGNINYSKGLFKSALNIYQQSLQLAKEISDESLTYSIFGEIGSSYYYLGIYQKAAQNLQRFVNYQVKNKSKLYLTDKYPLLISSLIELKAMNRARNFTNDYFKLIRKDKTLGEYHEPVSVFKGLINFFDEKSKMYKSPKILKDLKELKNKSKNHHEKCHLLIYIIKMLIFSGLKENNDCIKALNELRELPRTDMSSFYSGIISQLENNL